MNIGKVVLPREVAEAIENVRKRLGWTDEVILHKTYTNGWEAEWTEVLNANGDENKAFLIAQALVNGYEIEKSPEEKVREYYEFWSEKLTDRDYELRIEAREKLNGMIFVLNAYDIKIEGVNV
jgi:hypothetical protein